METPQTKPNWRTIVVGSLILFPAFNSHPAELARRGRDHCLRLPGAGDYFFGPTDLARPSSL